VSDRVANSAVQIGRGIRKLRKQRRWKQDVLAEESGLSRVTISLAENAKTNISLYDIERIAAAFSTNITGLMEAGRRSLRISDEKLKYTVGSNVYKRRLFLKLSRKQLGERVGFIQQYISTTENGRRLPTVLNLSRLAYALSVPTSQLLDENFYHEQEIVDVKIIDPSVLGARLQCARLATQQRRFTVSRSAGVTPQIIGKFETGETIPTIPTIIVLCKALGVPIAKILD